jgi:hypothetical protein
MWWPQGFTPERGEHAAILCAALGSAKLRDLDRQARVAGVIDRLA